MNTQGQVTVRQWFRLPKDERQRRAAGFRDAYAALQANAEAEEAAGVEEETEEYLRLNHRVNDLWPTVPWWCRSAWGTDDGRFAARLITCLCGLVVFTVGVILAVAPGYARWSHVLILVVAAAAVAAAALAYLYGTRGKP